MPFTSTPELRTEIVTACKVLTYFKIVEGFGHVSARVPGAGGEPDRVIITPRRALGLVTEGELVELDMDGRQVAGEIARPPLEAIMHVAVYKRRPEVMGIARGHPRHVAAYACAGTPLKVAHGFGCTLAHSLWTFGLSPAKGLITLVKAPVSSLTTVPATCVERSQYSVIVSFLRKSWPVTVIAVLAPPAVGCRPIDAPAGSGA